MSKHQEDPEKLSREVIEKGQRAAGKEPVGDISIPSTPLNSNFDIFTPPPPDGKISVQLNCSQEKLAAIAQIAANGGYGELIGQPGVRVIDVGATYLGPVVEDQRPGMTRLAERMLQQDLDAGHKVVIFDPKGQSIEAEIKGFTSALPRPDSPEAIDQIKKDVKAFRVAWQPTDSKKPSLAQTYQMVAKALGFKTWESMVAVAGKTDASSNCSHPAPVQNTEVDFLSWLRTLSPNMTNNNILVVGMSGAGKTALIKQLVVGWANAGIGVDIVDLGNSHNGESPRNHGFCLFYNSDDFAAGHAAAVLACACESYFLSQGVDVGSSAIAQSLDMACRTVFEERGTSGSVDNVIAALTNLGLKHPNQKKLFKYISEALQPYSSSGRYKAFFSGVSGGADDYKRNVVAWEMEPYLEHSEMAPVAYVAMLHKMLARIYYWKRQRRVVVIEEGWHVLKILSRLGKFSGNAVTSIFEDLFRATRMYGGGVLFTLQSLFDLEPFGVAGESQTYASSRGKVIYANSPTKLLLHGHDYSDAVDVQRIELSQEELRAVEDINRSGVAYVQSTGFCGIIDFSEMR